ncbi:MAG: PPOX class F420-dependent oxidoreductase [Acidimicrobiia bacterium]
MLEEGVRRLAKGRNFAALTTLLPDGQPMTHVMWVDCDDEHILINTETHRQKARNMRRDPRVTVTVLDLGDWYRAVTLLGRVVELRDDEGLVDIDRLSQRYRGTPYKNRERPRVTALVKPERWHEHS